MKAKIIIFTLIANVIFLVSCDKKVQKFSKPNSDQNLGNGEWKDSSDTLNGISVRGNKIAFFKNMVFNSDQINEYQIIDSIYKIDNNDKKSGEYLLITNSRDSVIFKISKRDKKSILLIDSKQIAKKYIFWR
jgi:hypothetical protein